jgi:hypothetical protein
MVLLSWDLEDLTYFNLLCIENLRIRIVIIWNAITDGIRQITNYNLSEPLFAARPAAHYPVVLYKNGKSYAGV